MALSRRPNTLDQLQKSALVLRLPEWSPKPLRRSCRLNTYTMFDSKLFGNIFGTDEIRQCFSERTYVANLIEAECALAQAESDEGVVPVAAAQAIREHSSVDKIDWDLLAARTEIVGYPVLPLIEQMSKWVPDEHGE
ncbi:3-carboxy-muconate cycloisomerase [Diplodia corticola]|uniref:3-carboxy-muconate cycloisomerase n=1 Tax=Diplodia corticola TaxID=236234 RepID=A0A1J9S3X9_9PEZI|nr:3-carboxy-muconate cycloisomerase [Diplodia corticola]OJD35247.1 3-carboxy-muconate cycloisomerase [Diplodia corticola]